MNSENNTMLAAAAVQGQGVFHRNALSALTEQLGMTDYNELAGILVNTIMPKASNEELAAFALVCSTYRLNPLTREVYAFPTKAGGIMPMIGIDGWLKIAHSHPDYAGMGWAEGAEDNDRWCECTVWLKSTPEHPVTIREYLSECRQASSPVWAQRPKRMLRHRATIQAIRYALGISGVADGDDYEEQGYGGSMQLRDVTRKPVSAGSNAPSGYAAPTVDEPSFLPKVKVKVDGTEVPCSEKVGFKPNFLRNEAAVGSTKDDLRGANLNGGSELPMFGEMV